MTGLFFVQKLRFFFKHSPILQKSIFLQSRTCFSSYTHADDEKKNCFCSSFKFAVVLAHAAKKHAAGEWLQCRHFEIFVNDKISGET